MTAFIPGLIVGFILGVFALGLLGALVVLHRPRYVAPTKYRRQWRDAPGRLGPEFEKVLNENLWDLYAADPKPIEPLYMYGVTGEER